MASLNSNARTDATGVKEIFDTDLTDDELRAHINAAAEEVDDIAAQDSSVSSQRLTIIEKYLAAHIASTQDPRVSDASVGDAQFNYKGATDTTDYFETAASLDPTGLLSSEGTKLIGVSVPNSRSIDENSTTGDRY